MSFLRNPLWQKLVLGFGVLFSLSPWCNSAEALFFGVFCAVIVGNPMADTTGKISQKLLTYSVVGLGAGMNLITVASVGLQGIGYTAVSISLTLALGWILGKLLKSDSETSWLISFGTAICGGSAIAALAPVIRAKPQSITVALGIVFLLNSIALLIFPSLGNWMDFSQHQFGLWAALAIHDTSSVVATCLQYGALALQVGTTVKLARALWIVPLVFIFGFALSRGKENSSSVKTKKPWFILGFLIAAALATWIPQLHDFAGFVETLAKKGLVLTLFLIGSNLTLKSLKAVGAKPLILGLLLWLLVAVSTACVLKFNLIV